MLFRHLTVGLFKFHNAQPQNDIQKQCKNKTKPQVSQTERSILRVEGVEANNVTSSMYACKCTKMSSPKQPTLVWKSSMSRSSN